jgi:hypothetical protein
MQQISSETREATAAFLRALVRFTLSVGVAAGVILGLALVSLRWFGLIDGVTYSTFRIIAATVLVGVLFPGVLCLMFWVLTRNWWRRWSDPPERRSSRTD